MATDAINEFLVEAVFPQDNQETVVTGFMRKGAFHKGESLSLISAQGIPLLAPIARIGSAETPVNIVREGQKIALSLKVEPHHVSPGSRLTTRSNGDAFGSTVIVTEASSLSATDREVKSQSDLERAQALLDIRAFHEAKDLLKPFLYSHPESAAGHRLMARLFLEAEGDLADRRKALEHVKKAFEYSGGNDAAVQETLAQALGANDEPKHGLRYLERLYESALTSDGKARYAERIGSYRRRYEMADHWEFLDQFGAVVFESSDVHEIVKAFKNGVIDKEGDCRKNRVGEILSIRETLGHEEPAVARLYASPIITLAVDYGIALGAGLLVAVLVGAGGGVAPVVAMVCGAFSAAATVILLQRQRASV